MVIHVGKLQPLQWMRSNSVIFLCGALTFLYIIELSLGIRIVCFVCEQWKRSKISEPYSNHIGWNIGITSILIAILAAGSVNLLSVYWEHRKNDTNESLSRTRITSHVVHALTGGILWRYIALWRAEDVKKEAMLLTSAKFLFTQFYTIPLSIVHVSVSTDLNDAVFDVALITSATVTILLTCLVFKDGPEMHEHSSFCETMILVPLIFRQPPEIPTEEQEGNKDDSHATHPSDDKKTWAICLLRIVVSVQIFFFSYGRLLALGFLLKLAGIYAVTVLFLQILISALYLKFQAPYLFAETQLKHKQLMRLVFLSYVLVFEWHLHREKDTGYNLGTKVRQGLLYYCTTTIESVFYITVWALTDGNKISEELFQKDTENKYQTKNVVLLVGCLSLVISAVIHIFLALVRSYRKVEVFSRIRQIRETFEAVRRRLRKTSVQQSSVSMNPASFVDIASFSKSPGRCQITVPKLDASHSSKFCDDGISNSYCDFKDRIDDHVHIDPKGQIYNSETSKNETSSDLAERENGSFTKDSFITEAKTSRDHRTIITKCVNENIAIKDEIRRPNTISQKSTSATSEASENSCATPKHIGTIARLWGKYSKFSTKRFSRLGDRFRNLGITASYSNEKQKTWNSNSPEKRKDHPNARSEKAMKISVEAPSKVDILQKSPAKLKQSFDVGKVKQTCKKIKNVTRKFNLSPESSRATWKNENVQNVSDVPEKIPTGRSGKDLVASKTLNDQKKSNENETRESNAKSEDEEDGIFLKVSIPKILISSDRPVTIDETLHGAQSRTDHAKAAVDMMPMPSNRQRESDAAPPQNSNQ